MGEELPPDLLDDVEGSDREDREALLRWLLERGVSLDELREAKRQNRLALLPTEYVLTRGCSVSLAEAAERTGIRTEFVERVWRVAGIPVPGPNEAVIDAEDDLQAMRVAKLALDAGMSEDTYVEISRVVGRAADAIAQAMVEETSEAFVSPGEGEARFAMRIQEFAETVMPVMPSLVAFPVRMHLRDSLRNQAVERTEQGVEGLKGTRRMAIGFADLAGFSSVSERGEVTEPSRLASKLEELAIAAANPPVRVVKLIGDEAMLVCDEVEPLVEALTDLRHRAAGSDELPPLHIGAAVGEVVPRAGDVYGRAVNLASRLTSASAEGQFLISPEVAESVNGFELRELDPVELKGVGEVTPTEVLGRSGSET